MIVPFVNKQEDPIEKYLNDLDEEMSQILARKDLGIDEKLALYNQTLNRFLLKESNSKIQVTHHTPEVTVTVKESEPKTKKQKKETFVPIKHSPKKLKKEILKKETIKKDEQDNFNTADESMVRDEENANMISSLMQNLKPTTKNNNNLNIFQAPKLKDRTKAVLGDYNSPQATRSHVKNFNVPLMGDPYWNVNTGHGLRRKWLTKKFF